MKVALILASNTIYAPHMYHYIRILNEEKIDFDIIIWNKDNITEDNCISYNEFSDLKKSRLFRVKSYFRYVKFVKDVLSKNEYKRVVVFTIFLGILLYPYLKKEFKKAYFFDIRDYSPVLNFIPWILVPIINDSFSTAISSSGFTKWLPKSKKYLLSHNYHFNDKILPNKSEFHSEFKYTILTIGFLRDFEMNKTMINSFRNDTNILMKFVGRGIAYEPLIEFVKENKIKNVVFTGAYDKKDEIDYLNKASLINILLGDDINSKTLMTNRLYLAVSNRIPVIVNGNSTQGEYVSKYNLGIEINDMETINQTVLAYLDKFNREEFLKGSEKFLSDINADQEEFEMSFKKFIK